MNSYEAKQEARRERYEELAAKNRSAATSLFDQSHRLADQIPMGQPILIGHHSEKRHRRHLERIDNTMRRGVEASDKAAYYAQRAASVGTAGISSDDPDATDKLTERITKLERDQEKYKAINKIVQRKPKNISTPEKLAELVALGLPEAAAVKMFEGDFCGRFGIPSYVLQNNNANIRRLKDRLATLAKAPTETTEQDAGVCRIVENAEENRIQLLFPNIPPESARDILKRAGFRWSRYNRAWQRHLNNAGRCAAKYAVEQISKLTAANTAGTEQQDHAAPSTGIMPDAEYSERSFLWKTRKLQEQGLP